MSVILPSLPCPSIMMWSVLSGDIGNCKLNKHGKYQIPCVGPSMFRPGLDSARRFARSTFRMLAKTASQLSNNIHGKDSSPGIRLSGRNMLYILYPFVHPVYPVSAANQSTSRIIVHHLSRVFEMDPSSPRHDDGTSQQCLSSRQGLLSMALFTSYLACIRG
jgi:hypothetical protein